MQADVSYLSSQQLLHSPLRHPPRAYPFPRTKEAVQSRPKSPRLLVISNNIIGASRVATDLPC